MNNEVAIKYIQVNGYVRQYAVNLYPYFADEDGTRMMLRFEAKVPYACASAIIFTRYSICSAIISFSGQQKPYKSATLLNVLINNNTQAGEAAYITYFDDDPDATFIKFPRQWDFASILFVVSASMIIERVPYRADQPTT